MPQPTVKTYQGPAFLANGFRPFFLLGALYAGLAALLWLPMLAEQLSLRTLFGLGDWHAHEMLFGFVPAIIAGFLLTAIPNWTGRLPIRGWPLLALVAVWICGRFAISFSQELGWLIALLLDCAFLATVLIVAAHEIIAGKNRRNLKILLPMGMLLIANILFHIEANFTGTAEIAKRLALSAITLLILLIGGRIIPSFSRNWLAKQSPGRLPIPFSQFDMLAIALTAIALIVWSLKPDGPVSGSFLSLAALTQTFRLCRWAGERTLNNPLVFILHIGFAFIPLGLCLNALAAFSLVPEAAGIHALGMGAFGTLTLAIMVRATLGHTGRPLHAGPSTIVIFIAVLFAAIIRIAAALDMLSEVAIGDNLIQIAGYSWSIAYLGFVAIYSKPIVTPRK